MYTIHLGQTLFAASSSTQLPDVVLQGISGGQDSSVKTQFRNDKMLQECKRRMNMRNAKAEFGLDWYSISGGPANDKVPGQVNMHGVLSAAAVVVWGASSGILRAIMLEQSWDVQFMLSRSAVLNLSKFERKIIKTWRHLNFKTPPLHFSFL